jgi:ribokinase
MITYVSHLPRAGETIKGNNFQTGFGGKGANQAIQIARLAHVENYVRFIGKIGKDSIGHETRANFTKHLVDVTHLLIAEDASVPSGVAAISVDEKGENSIVIVGGANDLLTAEEARAAVTSPTHRDSQYLLVQLEVPLETSYEAMRAAKELGMKVSS